MIIVKFQGRLGNQMFQYAAALCVSKKFNTFCLIDCSSKSVFLKYFKNRIVDGEFLNRILLKWFKKRLSNTVNQIGDEDITEMKQLFKDNTYYKGFFQSEDYFEGYKSYLQKNLVIKKKYRLAFNDKYGQLFKENKIIAIHCRLGDYLNWGSEELGGRGLALPKSYFRNALNKINQVEKFQVIIVTDDIENIENRFDFIENKIIISEEEIIDFQILQNAHQLILSNSSFSWWAAYLNNKTAPVYAPEYWLGFKVEKEFPVSILPENFIKIPIY
jgi:hypothetical protein